MSKIMILEFVAQTDAADERIGVVLEQRQGLEERSIIFHRKFTDLERSFSASEKEVPQ